MTTITNVEMGLILEYAGFSHHEFAKHLRITLRAVRSIIQGDRPITLRHMQALEKFLGELFDPALALAQKRLAEKETE